MERKPKHRKFRVEHDRGANAIYIRLKRFARYDHGQELDDARTIDFSKNNQPIGIELLGVSLGVKTAGLPEEASIRQLLADRNIPLIPPFRRVHLSEEYTSGVSQVEHLGRLRLSITKKLSPQPYSLLSLATLY